MMLRVALSLVVCTALALPLAAQQDRTQTLADIRQELSVLFVELQRLQRELNTTGGAQGTGVGGSTLARVDAIEAELRRLTSLTEVLELRIDSVVSDGTNRVGDLEFRLCELEPDCDIATLGDTPNLGGVEATPSTPFVVPEEGSDLPAGGANLAVAEEDDFNRAQAAFDAGDFTQAATLFETFTQTYPGGPLSAEAHFLRGQSEAQQDAWNRAARAYLDAFTADPEGVRAPEALLNLGTSLGQIGQTEEACLTLAEVGNRYPGSAAVGQAGIALSSLGCQ